MTPDGVARAADIRARADAATDGPWFGASQNRRKDGVGIVGAGQGETAAPIAVLAGARQTIKDRAANTAFIAAARADVPWLLDRLAAETERADQAEAAVLRLCHEHAAQLAQRDAFIDRMRGGRGAVLEPGSEETKP